MTLRNKLPELFQNTRQWSPTRDLTTLQRRMDHFFRDLWDDPSSSLISRDEKTVFEPECDIEESDSHFYLTLDIPGISKEDVRVEIRNNQLVISGERKMPSREKGVMHLNNERFYGTFQRVFTLPSAIDPSKVEANFQYGVLQITIQKIAATKAQRIEIQETRAA